MIEYKWTLIIKNVENEYVKTNHYGSKALAMEDLRYYTNMGYIVTILTYAIYLTTNKSKLEN